MEILNIDGKAGGGIRAVGCGLEASAFYRLATQLNLETLQNIVNNWTSLAIISTLYMTATYFPVLKEVMVGAEVIANNIAKLRNLNCQSAVKMMTDYFKGSSKIVSACVLRKLDSDIDVWKATPEEIKQAIEDSPNKDKLNEIYQQCMNNPSVFDALGSLESVNKWLKKKNFRKWVACNWKDTFGFNEDFQNRYSIEGRLLANNDVKTMAKVAVLAMTPEWIATTDNGTNLKKIISKPLVYTTEDGKTREITIDSISMLLREDVSKQVKEIIDLAEQGDIDEAMEKLDEMNEKFYIDDPAVKRQFLALALGYIKASEYKDVDKAKYYEIKALLDNARKELEKQYYLIKKRQLLRELVKQVDEAMQRKKMAEKAGVDPCGDNST